MTRKAIGSHESCLPLKNGSKHGGASVYPKLAKYNRTSMAQTPLEPRKYVQDRGSLR